MQRIAVIGCGGAGKTTLARELGVYDRTSWEFLRWILSFRRRQRPRILELLSAYDGEQVVLHDRREARRFLRSVQWNHSPGCSRLPAGAEEEAVRGKD